MLRTLQFYVGRELAKTFLLAAVGLTLVFSLCGGVLNMIRTDVLTALQVFEIIKLILPVSLTLTLPVAALFACAMVYGRFAADNEFDACRASGVNIIRLFAPAMALSIFTACFTFFFANFLLPTFIGRIEGIVSKDLQQIALSSLKSRGFIRYGPYVLYARESQLHEGGGEVKTIQVNDGAFLELEGESLRSAGTAAQARVDFNPAARDGAPVIKAVMFDVRRLDLKRNQFQESQEQALNAPDLPNRILREKPKFLTLAQLRDYQQDLTRARAVQEKLESIRLLLVEAGFYRWAFDQLTTRGSLTFQQGNRKYSVTAEKASLDATDLKPELNNVKLTEWLPDHRRDYTAERAALRFKRGYGSTPHGLQIALRQKVKFVDSRDKTNTVERREVILDDIEIPPEATREAQSITIDRLLNLSGKGNDRFSPASLHDLEMPDLGYGERIHDARVRAKRDLLEMSLEITSIIHSRLAFSASVLVMLVLSAALAIIFRGGQLLTAFVISFVPGLLVVVFNIMGRQLAERYPTQMAGIITIWAVIGVVAVADFVVVGKFLKR